MTTDRPTLRPGDRVRYSFIGQEGDTGTVVSVHPKQLHTGGSKALVKVKWDSNGHVGTQEERALVLLSASEG